MRDLLKGFSKDALAEYICQRCWHHRREIEKDLLFMQYELEAKAAQDRMDDACKRMNSTVSPAEIIAARNDFDRALQASKKAERLWKKWEALSKC